MRSRFIPLIAGTTALFLLSSSYSAFSFTGSPTAGAKDFPAGDEAYHTVSEVEQFMDKTVKKYPELAQKKSLGKSVEGRDLWTLKIGKGKESDPEVFIMCNQHAREHLSTEQCIDAASQLTENYASTPRVKNILDHRNVWILPVANPDGSQYDIDSGRYLGWRKNRSKNSDGSFGIDLNRSWGYKWNCCGGSSSNTASNSYHGPSAFAPPETRAISDFIKSRSKKGVQNIKGFLDIHTYGEMILWPFGYTTEEKDEGKTAEQSAKLAALGKKIASLNGFAPMQTSSSYITDGEASDWAWGDQGIPALTMELSPKEKTSEGNGPFYPAGKLIPQLVQRNREAILTFIELSA
ncbi:M14 family metallopeptidase [Dermatophilus congolensis]|uniref:M14 family metallopeptidase n=1 Tax=Dermatophilus congolensis TaxID=1863 RepID=UPI001AAE8DF1|nr:M14 family metallopeptidase [Dermatophilus congolensis]MBO3130320.1 zinc carboxypeptidase [Dermatophilus congolensis]MBO3131049.1 zinc carboxypeptidase [Dermatophilus congolensis]MBO3134791.1 zinc carboxypeptidase [Dermatophilus congolensis]MBO3137027.1 zinc carboxypeptidase [Dermatophilus congolensis]MBO3139272.1 zinc carboxypeptidase [Dermatophilus congolensis]